ncbi:AF4/FMR2 family member 4 [Orchesella cincta]|uniref:AF4/FMR2 family member lilli n=1 Tax=Orchesella cincta TaxID=48709 RepID=A0A1D2M3U7_ORCCI|nr:AF4/FMR2 family member 4 [Orchesella cincta]
MEPGSGYRYVSVGASGGGDEDKPLDLSLSLPLSTSSRMVRLHFGSSKAAAAGSRPGRVEVATKALIFWRQPCTCFDWNSNGEGPNLVLEALKMYVDTLELVKDIGDGFSTETGPLEAIIVVLTTRCQSLLSLKLFEFKTHGAKIVVRNIHEYLQRCLAPQIIRGSESSGPCSPEDGGSPEIWAQIPYDLYCDMKTVVPTQMDLHNAQEWWERADADHFVNHHGIQDGFKLLDSPFGPLTFSTSLVDLVRYVKEAIRVLMPVSDRTQRYPNWVE